MTAERKKTAASKEKKKKDVALKRALKRARDERNAGLRYFILRTPMSESPADTVPVAL